MKKKFKYYDDELDAEVDYGTLRDKAIAEGDFSSAKLYEDQRNAKIASGYGMGAKPTFDYNKPAQTVGGNDWRGKPSVVSKSGYVNPLTGIPTSQSRMYDSSFNYDPQYHGDQLRGVTIPQINDPGFTPFKYNPTERKYNPPNMGIPIGRGQPYLVQYGNHWFDPNVDYMKLAQEAADRGDYNQARRFEELRNAKIDSGYGGVYQKTYEFNYNPKFQQKVEDLAKQYEEYPEFQYDYRDDPMYAQMKQRYVRDAENASDNVVAQASALNSGRANSNALIAGNLAYQDKMTQLESRIPELQQIAYNKYNAEKQDVRNSLADYGALEAQNYSQWVDNFNRKYGDSWKNLEWDEENQRYYDTRDYNRGRDKVEDTRYDEKVAYGKERDKVADSQWDKEYAHRVAQDNEANRLTEKEIDARIDQNKADNDFRNAKFGYQVGKDAWNQQYKVNKATGVYDQQAMDNLYGSYDTPSEPSVPSSSQAPASSKKKDAGLAVVKTRYYSGDVKGAQERIDEMVSKGLITQQEAIELYNKYTK